MNHDIHTPKVRTSMRYVAGKTDDDKPVFKDKAVVVSLWRLFGTDAPVVRREVLEAN